MYELLFKFGYVNAASITKQKKDCIRTSTIFLKLIYLIIKR